MAVIRGALQTQRESEANYQLQSSLQRLTDFLQSSPVPPVALQDAFGHFSYMLFTTEFEAKTEKKANAGTKMIQVHNFKKKGMRPNQKTINVKDLKKPVSKADDLIITATQTNLEIKTGDVVYFNTTPALTRVVKSVSNPNAAVRTIVFEESFPFAIPAGTSIKVGKNSRIEFADNELRLYQNGQQSYDILCRRLDMEGSRIMLSGSSALISLETLVPTTKGDKILRAQARVSYAPDSLFYSEFGGSTP